MLELSRSISLDLAESKRLGSLLLSSFQVRFLELGNVFVGINCYYDNLKEISILRN